MISVRQPALMQAADIEFRFAALCPLRSDRKNNGTKFANRHPTMQLVPWAGFKVYVLRIVLGN